MVPSTMPVTEPNPPERRTPPMDADERAADGGPNEQNEFHPADRHAGASRRVGIAPDRQNPIAEPGLIEHPGGKRSGDQPPKNRGVEEIPLGRQGDLEESSVLQRNGARSRDQPRQSESAAREDEVRA